MKIIRCPETGWSRLLPIFLAVVLAGCGRSTAMAVSDVYTDVTVVLSNEDGRVDGSTFHEMAKRLRRIDTSGCPVEIVDSVNRLIDRLRDFANAVATRDAIVARRESNAASDLTESFVRGFAGDPFGKTTEVMAEYNAGQRRVEVAYDAYMNAVRDFDAVTAPYLE